MNSACYSANLRALLKLAVRGVLKEKPLFTMKETLRRILLNDMKSLTWYATRQAQLLSIHSCPINCVPNPHDDGPQLRFLVGLSNHSLHSRSRARVLGPGIPYCTCCDIAVNLQVDTIAVITELTSPPISESENQPSLITPFVGRLSMSTPGQRVTHQRAIAHTQSCGDSSTDS
jgi:hypothetical protein